MSSTEQTTGLSREAVVDFLSGIVGGTTCAYTGQPLDTIKVKMQTYPSLYRSTWKCLRDTIRQEGFLRLYAGALPAVAANVAENAVLFLSYGQCCKVVAWMCGVEREKMTLFQKACSGSFAAVFAAFALCPPELVKCRMQTLGEFKGSHKNITPLTIIRDVLRTDGVLGFYYGITSTLLREVPGYFFFFGGYEGVQMMFNMYDQRQLFPLWSRTIIAGGMGGTALWMAIYPFDVIKSRMQVNSQGSRKLGLTECARMLAKEEGVRSFYKGITPTLLRAFPACAALFLGVEYSKMLMYRVSS